MKKLIVFLRAVALLCLLSAGGAHAQYYVPVNSVQYLITDGSNRSAGMAMIHYQPDEGFTLTLNGTMVSTVTTSRATVYTGGLTLSMAIDGQYWHNRLGETRQTFVTNSHGGVVGAAKMSFDQVTAAGKIYREELWLNGRMFSRSTALVGHDNVVNFIQVIDSQGVTRITRL